MKKKIRIVLTCGHAGTTALATIEELLRRTDKFEWEIYWIGPDKALEGSRIPSLESKVFPKLGVFFHPIIAGRLQRNFTIWTIPSLMKVPIAFFHAVYHIFKIKPKVILSFGGYASLPIVIIGFLYRIPIVVHEQTAAAGLANRMSALFAKKIALARRSSLDFFPNIKTVVVGNPVLSQVLEVSPKKNISSPPVLFVTGGSRGSSRINKTLDKILESILEVFVVIHLTGENDFEYFSERKKHLAPNINSRYEVRDFVDPMQIDNIYRMSDIIIGRSGANTISEINIVGRPAVLIPISWVQHNEQLKNAKILEKSGLALIIEEKDMNPDKLFKKILFCLKSWKDMANKGDADISNLDKKASEKLVDIVLEILKK